jgi:endonuclease YncB( thermonuclease family)
VLVRQGRAVVLTYPPNVQYVDWFTQAPAQAREDGLGLWSVGGFDCLPIDGRRGRCD